MNKYEDARNEISDVLKRNVGIVRATELLTDLIVGAGWQAIERAHNQTFAEADKYLRRVE